MSIFENMLHHQKPQAANDNVKDSLHIDTRIAVEDTINHFYEIMSNSEDLQALKMNVAANDNSFDMQAAA